MSRELLDDNHIDKWDYINHKTNRLFTAEGALSNNSTKATPNLQADLFGDWREEVIWRNTDSTELRIYTTTSVTDTRLRTLMHDPIYRLGVAWQNTGYNQPPHTSFYLGTGMEKPPAPRLTVVNEPVSSVPPTTTDTAPAGWVNHDVTVTLTARDNGSGVGGTYYTVNGGAEQKGTSVTLTNEGTHTLIYWSVDNQGNAEAPHTVLVRIDKTEPTLNLVLDKTELWPANHKMIPVKASVSADDSLSGISSVVLTSITSSEPDNGLGDGDTADDIQGAQPGTLDTEFMLRAERSGKGNGRVYTVTYTAADAAGNKTSQSATVKVPHNK